MQELLQMFGDFYIFKTFEEFKTTNVNLFSRILDFQCRPIP